MLTRRGRNGRNQVALILGWSELDLPLDRQSGGHPQSAGFLSGGSMPAFQTRLRRKELLHAGITPTSWQPRRPSPINPQPSV